MDSRAHFQGFLTEKFGDEQIQETQEPIRNPCCRG